VSPARIQRRRTRGWTAPLDPQGRKPVYVGRGTRFGNPWAVVHLTTGSGWAVQWAGHRDQHRPLGLNDLVLANDQRDAHRLAVELFECWVYDLPRLIERACVELRGRDLMCWCAESLSCHADVLLDLANKETAS
jgi:hypothetical protein